MLGTISGRDSTLPILSSVCYTCKEGNLAIVPFNASVRAHAENLFMAPVKLDKRCDGLVEGVLTRSKAKAAKGTSGYSSS